MRFACLFIVVVFFCFDVVVCFFVDLVWFVGLIILSVCYFVDCYVILYLGLLISRLLFNSSVFQHLDF